MEKELLIKNIIGNVLEPEGFFYKGSDQICSEFFRRVKNKKGETIRQSVCIQNEYDERLILFLDSAYSKRMMYDVDDIIPGYPGVEEHSFYYRNEEEFKEAIENYAHILKEYGILLLEELKEVQIPKDAFRDEDVERLYYQHEQLVENLLKRENRKIEEFNVEEVAEFIEKRIEEVKEEPFHKVKELLLELSGLFGAVANRFYPCEWEIKEYITLNCDLKFPEPKEIKYRWRDMCVMGILKRGWQSKRPKGESRLRHKRVNNEGIEEELLLQYGYCTEHMKILKE